MNYNTTMIQNIKINIKTHNKKQIIDITEEVQNYVNSLNIEKGLVNVFILHTTSAITTADLDPGTDLDMLDAFEAIIPKLKYRHPHNPRHAPDHILSSIIGSSVIVPIEDGELLLGTWQRIVLVELDGPRDRNVILSFIKS